MFENLSERLERSFKILKGEGKITEINVAETLKDVRKALLDADVNYKVAKQFTDTVKQKALGMNVLTAIKPSQLMVKIVHDELAELMGGKAVELKLEGRPSIVLMSGLQGSGKTTFSGKLANMLKTKQHKNPLLVACDVYRPAAIQQLHVVGESVGVPVYSEPDNKNVVEIAQNAIREAKQKNYNVVIIDTAGRLAVDEEMMNEIATLKQAVQPDETLFVVDSMTGQDAVNTAKEFNDRLDFDGVVLTKLDGDTRGASLWVLARRWKPSTCSILSVWPTASWVWVTSSHLLSALRSSSTRKRLSAWRRRFARISSTSTTSWVRFSRSRRWVTSRISPA